MTLLYIIRGLHTKDTFLKPLFIAHNLETKDINYGGLAE